MDKEDLTAAVVRYLETELSKHFTSVTNVGSAVVTTVMPGRVVLFRASETRKHEVAVSCKGSVGYKISALHHPDLADRLVLFTRDGFRTYDLAKPSSLPDFLQDCLGYLK